MRQQPVKDHQRACCHRQGQGTCHRWPGHIAERLHAQRAALTHIALTQRPALPAGIDPQTAVIQSRVFQRKPKRGHGLRCRLEECSVLVPAHFTTNARLFEDDLALPYLGLEQAQISSQFGQRSAV